MTITIPQTKTVSTQIQIPSFFMGGNSTYVGFLNEHTVIKIYKTKDYISVTNGTPDEMRFYLTDLDLFVPIDESQFFTAHEEVLESLSLSPKLTHRTFTEDLASIGLNRKEVI